MKKKLQARFDGFTATRTTARVYTHAVYCPAYTFVGNSGGPVAGMPVKTGEVKISSTVTWAGSLQLAERAAELMGWAWDYTKATRRNRRGERVRRVVEPQIAAVEPVK